MKRQFTAILAVAGLASALAGCASQRNEDKGMIRDTRNEPVARDEFTRYEERADVTQPRSAGDEGSTYVSGRTEFRSSPQFTWDQRDSYYSSMDARLSGFESDLASMRARAAGNQEEERRVRYHERRLELLRNKLGENRNVGQDQWSDFSTSFDFELSEFERGIDLENSSR